MLPPAGWNQASPPGVAKGPGVPARGAAGHPLTEGLGPPGAQGPPCRPLAPLTLSQLHPLELEGDVVAPGEDVDGAAGLREQVQVQLQPHPVAAAAAAAAAGACSCPAHIAPAPVGAGRQRPALRNFIRAVPNS